MASLPKPSPCPCGHAGEVQRLRDLIDVLVQVRRNDAERDEPSVSYSDPVVARSQARRGRIAASGLTVITGGC